MKDETERAFLMKSLQLVKNQKDLLLTTESPNDQEESKDQKLDAFLEACRDGEAFDPFVGGVNEVPRDFSLFSGLCPSEKTSSSQKEKTTELRSNSQETKQAQSSQQVLAVKTQKSDYGTITINHIEQKVNNARPEESLRLLAQKVHSQISTGALRQIKLDSVRFSQASLEQFFEDVLSLANP